jgi:hypothetical protein
LDSHLATRQTAAFGLAFDTANIAATKDTNVEHLDLADTETRMKPKTEEKKKGFA